MAEVRALHKGIEVPERKTPDDIIDLIDHLRALAEGDVITALAIAYVINGEPEHDSGYESGEGYQLSGAVHSLALALDYELTFDEEE